MVFNADSELALTFDDGYTVQLRKGSRRGLLAAWLVPPSAAAGPSGPAASRLLRSDCAARAAKIEPYFRGWGRNTTAYAYFGPDIPISSYVFEIFGSIALFYTDANDDEPAGALPMSMMSVQLPPAEAGTFEKKSLFSSICEGKQVFELRLSRAKDHTVVLAWIDPDERAVWKEFIATYIARMDSIYHIGGDLVRSCLPVLRVEGGMAIMKRRGTAPSEKADPGSKKWMYLLWAGDPADWSILICKEAVADERVSLGLCKIPGLECKRFPLVEIEDIEVEAEPSTSLRIAVQKGASSRNIEASKNMTFIIDSDPVDRCKSLQWAEAIRSAQTAMQRLMNEGENAKPFESDDEAPDFRDKVFLASLQGKLMQDTKNLSASSDAKSSRFNWFSRSFRFSSLEADKSKPKVGEDIGIATKADSDNIVVTSPSRSAIKPPIEQPLNIAPSEAVSAALEPQSATESETGKLGIDERSSSYAVDSNAGAEDEVADDSDEEVDVFHDDDAHGAQRGENSGDAKGTSVSCFAFLFRWREKDDPNQTIESEQPKSRRSSLASDANLPIPGGHGDVVHRGTPKLKRVSFFSSETDNNKESASSTHASDSIPHDSRDFGNVDAKLKNRLWAANADEIIRADALAMKPSGVEMPHKPEIGIDPAPKSQANETAKQLNKSKASISRESSFLEQIETEYYSPDQDSDSDSQSNSRVPASADRSSQGRSKDSHELWWEGVNKHNNSASPRVIALTMKHHASTNSMSKSSRQLNLQETNSPISMNSLRHEGQKLSSGQTLIRQSDSKIKMPTNGSLGTSPVVTTASWAAKTPSTRGTIIKSPHDRRQKSSPDASKSRNLSESYFVNARLRDIDVKLELRHIDVVLHPVEDGSTVSDDTMARIYLSEILNVELDANGSGLFRIQRRRRDRAQEDYLVFRAHPPAATQSHHLPIDEWVLMLQRHLQDTHII